MLRTSRCLFVFTSTFNLQHPQPVQYRCPLAKASCPIRSPNHSRILAHILPFGDCKWSLVLCIPTIEWNVTNARQSNSKQQSQVHTSVRLSPPPRASRFSLLACLLATTCPSLHSVAQRLKRRKRKSKIKEENRDLGTRPNPEQRRKKRVPMTSWWEMVLTRKHPIHICISSYHVPPSQSP
ncbi:hypothetical protein LX32DRAFT_433714 [Colletotrichum zoysiae]|uniref:Uncharacterized protein n=1 Tax=Colletotrichum zoysiae TaxID=1216348 RepID=A0AAD9HGJ8_9PEZI|nr:hypothetical protein LX32DRAFT_433714 [Colletotrichum zoysiae]